jgi:hypothetical protein
VKLKLLFLFPVSILLFADAIRAQVEKSLQRNIFISGDIFSLIPQAPTTSLIPLDKWPDTLYFSTVYQPKLLGSPTIPISFSRIELSKDTFQVTPVISLGYGYTWFTGNFVFSEIDKIMVDPKFYFGSRGRFCHTK